MPKPRSRVLTIPNLISAARLLCVPVFLWMLWEAHPARRGAAVLLAVLGATDWIDGWIARHFDQGSELGKILDPTADRVLLVASAAALLHEGLSTGVDVMLCIVLAREVLIAVATVGLAIAGRAASTSSGPARRAPSHSCSRCPCSSSRARRRRYGRCST